MFPAFMYHREKLSKLVKDEEELKALGAGWVDSPAKCGLIPCDKDYRPHFEKDPDFKEEKPKAAKPSKEE